MLGWEKKPAEEDWMKPGTRTVQNSRFFFSALRTGTGSHTMQLPVLMITQQLRCFSPGLSVRTWTFWKPGNSDSLGWRLKKGTFESNMREEMGGIQKKRSRERQQRWTNLQKSLMSRSLHLWNLKLHQDKKTCQEERRSALRRTTERRHWEKTPAFKLH